MGIGKGGDRRDFIDHTSASSCVNSDFRLDFATVDYSEYWQADIQNIFLVL